MIWLDYRPWYFWCSQEYINYWKKTKYKEMLASQKGRQIHEYHSSSKAFLIPVQMTEELIFWSYLVALAAVITMSKMNYWGCLLKRWFVIQLWNYWGFGELKGKIFIKWIHPFLIPPFSRIKVVVFKHQRIKIVKFKHQRKIPLIIDIAVA